MRPKWLQNLVDRLLSRPSESEEELERAKKLVSFPQYSHISNFKYLHILRQVRKLILEDNYKGAKALLVKHIREEHNSLNNPLRKLTQIIHHMERLSVTLQSQLSHEDTPLKKINSTINELKQTVYEFVEHIEFLLSNKYFKDHISERGYDSVTYP